MDAETTVTLAPDAGGLEAAAELLRAGRLVAFPTETVYGLGANAASDRAVARIFAAKGRPAFNPLIIHLPDLEAAERLAERQLLEALEALSPAPSGPARPPLKTLVAAARTGSGMVPRKGLETLAAHLST